MQVNVYWLAIFSSHFKSGMLAHFNMVSWQASNWDLTDSGDSRLCWGPRQKFTAPFSIQHHYTSNILSTTIVL